jgi:hypothetical protein
MAAVQRSWWSLLLEGISMRGGGRLFHTLGMRSPVSGSEGAHRPDCLSRTIWKNLLIICPGLCIVRERVKKQRDHAAQRCQDRRRAAHRYPDRLAEELKHVCGHVAPDNSGNQWWVDAFTIRQPASSHSRSS